MGFASVGGDFVDEVALVGGDALGSHSRASGIDETLHGLVGVFLFASVDGGGGENDAVQTVSVMRGVVFFFGFISDGFLAYAIRGSVALHRYFCQSLFPIIFAVIKFDFPPDSVRDFTEIYAVCVGVADSVIVGVFLQYDDAVFIEVGAQAGFVAQQVFTGNTVDGFVPVFKFDVFIAVVFEPLNGIASAGFVLFCFNGDDAGASVMEVGGSWFPAFFFCECDGFNPREVITPAASDSVYVVVLLLMIFVRWVFSS